MAGLKKLIKFPLLCRQYHITALVRNKPVTNYDKAASALQSLQGERINRLLDAYEEFVGLTEVRNAQDQVTQAESNYRKAQEQRRSTQTLLTGIQSKIKVVAMDIEKTQRGTDEYLNLVTRENEIIKDEKDVVDKLTVLEDREKELFGLLSSALRESHEKERARAERVKYWGLMGSIIGAVVGLFGSTINNRMRMNEFRRIVTTAVESNQTNREKSIEFYMSINEQYGKIYHFLSELKSTMGIKTAELSPPKEQMQRLSNLNNSATEVQLQTVIDSLKQQEKQLAQELQKISEALTLKKIGDDESTVVYVGPEIKTLLTDTERNLEWKMKVQGVGMAVVISALYIGIPVLTKMFSNG